MIYRVDFRGNGNVENRSELVNISLLTETDLEEGIFKGGEERKNKQAIEDHYYTAIKRELPNYKLLSVIENYGHSKSAVASVTSSKA